MAERCPTCIFRPGNLMHLQSGRVKDMLDKTRRADSCIPCHESMEDDLQAVCRGQFDVLKTTPLQLAERLGCVVWWVRPTT